MLLNHLAEVSSKNAENLMTSHALATVWAPCLIREPQTVSLLEIGQNQKFCIAAIEIAIDRTAKHLLRQKKQMKTLHYSNRHTYYQISNIYLMEFKDASMINKFFVAI